jgi:acyl-coenzyme A synthetase/AMP-(fatty) acid ligase
VRDAVRDAVRPHPARFNFTVDVVERLARERAGDEALRAISSSGERRSFSFAQVAAEASGTAGALAALGVRRGDVVMTLMGARPEWVFAMLACWRLGAAALPCSEQLRAKDIALRIEQARPRLVLHAGRNRAELEQALRAFENPPLCIDVDEQRLHAEPSPVADTAAEDAALVIFTSGTAGEPRGAVHSQRYLWGQSVQAEHWLGARAGDLVWCTAASGWSKSARNAFVAPWSRGASCLLHDARFDPAERLQLLASERVSVLCQAPTEYRLIAKRVALDGARSEALRRLVSAGEPLNPEVMHAFADALGLDIHDGYGQTETGQLTGMPVGEQVRPGSMGRPLPGFGLEVIDGEGNRASDGELCLDPGTVPTFFRGYLGEQDFHDRRWRTGDHVRVDEDGFLWFEGRLDDVILSAGYRIGPFEVESALVAHPAVAEAAAVSAPDEERGEVVRAVVVLREGQGGGEQLVRELQEHVKRTTAPYKYPRIVEFRESLPKTASGKIKRAQLRSERR